MTLVANRLIDDCLMETNQSPGVSVESTTTERLLYSIYSHYHQTETQRNRRPALRFYLLVQRWKEDTQYMSSSSDMAMNSAYQQIIGMGEAALPLILSELRNEQDHWFWALESITGINVVAPQDKGYIEKMTEAWLDWGKVHGYIS